MNSRAARERELDTSLQGREQTKTKRTVTIPAAAKEENDELLCALDEIGELVPDQRKETPQPKPHGGKSLVRPSLFDGKGSWEDLISSSRC